MHTHSNRREDESDLHYLRHLAHVLTVPSELARLEAKAARNRDTAQLEKLRHVGLFLGLTTRVKHGFLWEVIPGTLGYLSKMHCELVVFERFARSPHSARHIGAPRNRRVEAFLCFFTSYARSQPSLRANLHLQSLYHHERLLWRIRTTRNTSNSAIAYLKHYPIDPRAKTVRSRQLWLIYLFLAPGTEHIVSEVPKSLLAAFRSRVPAARMTRISQHLARSLLNSLEQHPRAGAKLGQNSQR